MGERVIERVKNNISDAACSAVIHVVREIVKMEQEGEEVVAHPQLRARGVGIGHGCQQASVESMIGDTLGSYEVIALEEPLFCLYSDLFSIAADP